MERYRDIVPAFDAFLEALDRPLPVTARANPLKADVDDCVAALEALGASVERFDWYRDGFRVDLEGAGDDVSIGHTLPHYCGWLHGQEEVSMLPPVVLDAGPDDAVVDLCAAPGSKATQLAVDAGSVVANDDDPGRLAALRSNADRLGCTNVAVTNVDGRRFPGRDRFDGALVDAPCTGEGTARKNPEMRAGADPHECASLGGVQRQLLERAVELVRPGGAVVYATCTFAPEENEAVVASLLQSDDHDVRVEEPDLGLEAAPGITAWQGNRYPDAVARTRRIYPHLNDTGGFYVARLRVE